MKTLEIHRYIRACPACSWKPVGVEESALLSELIDHVKKVHEMGEPRIVARNIPVAGVFQPCDVATFGNHSYWRWFDRTPKPA
jgi:hypothetical protein